MPMGNLPLEAPAPHAAVRRLSTNDIPTVPGRARYTHLLDDQGRVLDDVIFTCLAPDRFLCVCNAGPRPRVVPWIRAPLSRPELRAPPPAYLCLALQGPEAPAILGALTRSDLGTVRPFRALDIGFRPPSGCASPPGAGG